MLVATALVLLMTPALGLFYAGLVRSKNTLNTFMMSVAAIAVATVTWAAVGYSLAFDGDGGLVGGLGNAFMQRRRLRPAGRDGDPRARLLRLPGDLLHHHRGADLRRGGRADALRPVPRLRGAVVGAGLRRARPLGLRRRLADRPAARSTSPAASRSRWPPASRPWRRRWWSAPARTTAARRSSPTTPSTSCSGPGCCGSAGSGSTAAAASRPARPACSPSPTRCSARRRRWSSGSRST